MEAVVAVEAAESEKRSVVMAQHDSQSTKTSNKRTKKSTSGVDQEKERGGSRGDGKAVGTEKETKKKEGTSSNKRDSKARADSIANSNSEVSVPVRSSSEKDPTSGQDPVVPIVEKETSAAALTRRRDAIRKRLSLISTESFLSNNICASFLPLLDAQLSNHEDQSVYDSHPHPATDHNSTQAQTRYVVGGRIKTHRDYLLEEVQW